ncbi:hypothetical protein WP50_33770, partial [Lactiplantibacillus plantarum]
MYSCNTGPKISSVLNPLVVNQIERPAIIAGKKDRRFDTTLLINGLPIIQIEEKRDTHDVDEALNQMHQYIDEAQYTDIKLNTTSPA